MQINNSPVIPESLASKYYDTKPAKRLVGLFGIVCDLDMVARTADALGSHLNAKGPFDRILCESHTWHIVIRYARCFGSNSARNAKLEEENVAALGDKDLLTLHQGLMSRRHNTFAHAGEQCSDRLIIHLLSDGEKPELTAMPCIEGPGPIVDPEQPTLIARLARALRDSVEERMIKCAAVVDQDMKKDGVDVLGDLRANVGKHATPEQQAVSIALKAGIL